jgi:large-conductance mechanosensitive channel
MSYLLHNDNQDLFSMPTNSQQSTNNIQPVSQPISSQKQSTNNAQPSTPSPTPSSSPSPAPTFNQGLFSGLNTFLNYKTGTILTYAICFGIGGAFKDLIQNIVDNIIQPLIVKLLILTKFYNIAGVSDIITSKNSIINISSALSSLITFIIVLLTVYVIFVLITNTVARQ